VLQLMGYEAPADYQPGLLKLESDGG
jgi:hypothetical protein